MKLNRDVLVTAIVKYQGAFFKLLDYIHNHDGSLEFPEYLYINLYNNEICKNDDDNNTHHHLSITSLVENGIFIHNDKNTGMITIERVIVDLLRFLDIKRTKELSYFDFEQLRKRIVDITHEVQTFDVDSQNYHDAMTSFNGLMSEIHSKIKENVNGLTAQVESIAKDYKLYDSGSTDVSVFDLYEKVTFLYIRYVLPCYEFINPEMEMVRTKTFSKAVQGLIEYHSELGLAQYKTANSIQFRKTAITSYYKNIALLARKLEQFSSRLENDRSYFLAIESTFSELMDCIISLRHGKQRNKYLAKDVAIFTKFTTLDGLSDRKSKYSTRLNFDKPVLRLRFKEYLTLVDETHIKEKKKPLTPIPPEILIGQDRKVLISRLLYKIKLPEYILDVQLFIYDFLKEKLLNFSLTDVLFGVEVLLPRLDQNKVTSSFNRNRLIDENYFFDYIILKFEKEKINV